MWVLENDALCLQISGDGCVVTIADKRRGESFSLDRLGRVCRTYHGDRGPRPLPTPSVVGCPDRVLVTFPIGAGLRRVWTLHEDHVEVALEGECTDVEFFSLPGSLLPAGGPARILVPVGQGLLINPGGECFMQSVEAGGHGKFSMAMYAVLARRGGLLVAHDSPCDWQATFGVDEQSGPVAYFEHRHCSVDGWADARVRIYPVDPTVQAVAGRYRSLVERRGGLKTWDEKIQAKPIVKDLFGCLVAFIGYNRSAEVDYAASARRLRQMGFESVFYYPSRMCHYSMCFRMGGDEPIYLDDQQMAQLAEVPGAHLAPWAWLVEAPQDAACHLPCRCDEQGKPVPGWRIDHQQWYQVCTPYQIDYLRQRLAGDMKDMQWLHFDVSASRAVSACHDITHELHGRRVMSRREDYQWTCRLLDEQTVGNRVVSSEGFGDRYTPFYDIGTTKLMPDWLDGSAIPVPLTMLVFHDSCIHDWWELHNYNPNPGFVLQRRPHGLGVVGSGNPELKSAMDALYGCPPNVFPFGRQYGWADRRTHQTFSFQIELDDPPVQHALSLALPVARLHKRIGMCRMTGFQMLSDDGHVQATEFSDGTRIVANLGDDERHVDGLGVLGPLSWREG